MLRLTALLLLLAVPAFAATPDASVKPRIAVLYFEPATTNVELQVFTNGLTSLMISDFVATDRLDVLEREKLEAAIKELKLGETRFADRSTFAKIGRILGVEYLVTGFLVTGGSKTKITAQLIKTEQTLFVGQAKVDLDPNDVFAGEEKVFELLTAQLVKLGAISAAAEPTSGKSSSRAWGATSVMAPPPSGAGPR